MRSNLRYPKLPQYVMDCEFDVVGLIRDVYNLTHHKEYFYMDGFTYDVWLTEWKKTVRLIGDVSHRMKKGIDDGNKQSRYRNIALLRNLTNCMLNAREEAHLLKGSMSDRRVIH